MLFATVETSTGSVANALRALGATVRKQDSDVGYIRADVPTDKADVAAKLAGVVGSELDQVFDLIPPDIDGDVIAATPPDTTPAQNAYMPTRDTGAPQFVAAHPTWDGRGVTIGILDTGIDLGHPALQTTTTGERKIVDWITYTDPATDSDPSWIAMNATVTVVGGTFTVGTGAGARTYTGAPDGTWRYGEFIENNNLFQRTNGSAVAEYRITTCSNRSGGGGDLNRNGVCDEIFAFLWDGTQNGYVWRDSDADRSFADETGMREYKKDFAVGEYGHDNTATALRESVPFVTQIDAAAGFVSLGVVSAAHATHVAGIAAGGTLFGSATGAAPGAQIVSIRVCLFTSGCTAHALTEGMIYATKNAHVDVVSMSIGGLPGLNDGNNARAILYNRLIDKWGAQIFLSAGNSGPGVNTIGDPAVATKAMAIGAYWTKDSVLANYGNTAVSDEALHDFSSRGPREDGGFKPEVVAPGNATSSVPTWQGQQCIAAACSPGLGMFNGTSMAAPQASGAAALLLSAAIPSEVGHKPAQLREAMTSSARYLTNYQAHEQGFGLINVGTAWDLLKTNLKTVDISSSVPVRTVLSGFLETPGVGRGIYDREGVHIGDAPYIRTYTFNRSDGGSGTYNLSWLGNDGTFALPAGQTTLSISNKGSASLAITVTPRATSGVSSAILRLDDPKTPGIEYATMNTVITSIPLNAANNYKATVAGSARRFEAGQPKAFFDVPKDATAIRMTLNVINGRVNATAVHPYGLPQTATAVSIPLTTGPVVETRILTIATVAPIEGVWEIVDAASRAAGPASSTYEVSLEAYKMTLDPASWTNDPTTIGTPYTQTFTATNVFAAVSATQAGSPFASVFSKEATIAAGGAQQTYDITVPTGTTQLQVTLGGASDPGADLDLFVYNCTTGTCVLAGSSTGSTANEVVTINSPAVGAWKAIVDPFAVPSGSTKYTYTDALANPVYGSVTVPANVPTTRATGEIWTFDATGTALTSAGEGRFLRASVSVRTTYSITNPAPTPPTVITVNLASGTVIFANLTP